MPNRLVIIVVATVIILVLAGGVIWALQRNAERIAISELKQKLDSGEKLLLIDVREDWELEQDGAISGAIHIPMAELDMRMQDIPKDVELVFY
jgi:rhodanese-related sulfurtransferase